MKLDLLDSVIVNKRNQCAVCTGQALEVVLDLPGLPLTGRFTKDAGHEAVDDGIDQQFLFCPKCRHGQLANQVTPKLLYNEQYHFRTSHSRTACLGTTFFLNTLSTLVPDRHFNCVLDIGCNDLHMLERAKDKATHRYGIDPLWQGKEGQAQKRGVKVIGQEIEDVDLQRHLNMKPDLVLCRHTLEHILQPHIVFEKVLNFVDDEAVIVIEVPSLDGLVQRLRFDQVFHQHLQYFSYYSLYTLMTSLGAEYVGHHENYHDWGAVCMVFIKRPAKKAQPPKALKESNITVGALNKGYELFRGQMKSASVTLDRFHGTELYGYGAAQMLPVLAYHMSNDLGAVKGILDDDVALHGCRYWNLPLDIQSPTNIADWTKTNIFLSAVDNVQPIMKRLFENRPRHIIYPFQVI